MAKLAPIFNDAQLINGIPATGAQLFTYVSGSSTKLATYTDEAGTTPQTNPIVLNARGEPENPIWLTEGLSYTFIFTASTDTDPPTAPIRTIDDITGINDASLTIEQWVDSGVTPTYVSATQFTLPGDQTSTFTVNRRIKALTTDGTVYAGITVSAYGALTTVTLDSAVLDSGLSAVSLGLITPNNTSIPILPDSTFGVSGSADLTKRVKLEVDSLTTATTRTMTVQDKDITIAGLDDVAGGAKLGSKIQDVVATVAANALTVTIAPTTLDFRSTTLNDGTPVTRSLAVASSVVVPNTATLGTVNGVAARIAVLAIDNAGSIEVAAVNVTGGFNLDETTLINTTTVGTGSDSANVAYSTTGRTGVAFRVLGYITITEASAGVWATAPTLVQGAGGQATNLVSLGFSALYESAQQTITAAGALPLPHGLGRKPLFYQAVLVNVTNEAGWTTGQEVPIPCGAYTSSVGDNYGFTMNPDATNLNVRFGSRATTFFVNNATTGSGVALTNANWRLVVRAWG